MTTTATEASPAPASTSLNPLDLFPGRVVMLYEGSAEEAKLLSAFLETFVADSHQSLLIRDVDAFDQALIMGMVDSLEGTPIEDEGERAAYMAARAVLVAGAEKIVRESGALDGLRARLRVRGAADDLDYLRELVRTRKRPDTTSTGDAGELTITGELYTLTRLQALALARGCEVLEQVRL